jgi:transcription antitermination factor NusG
MSYWACARTEPQREAAAKHFLELAGYRTYIPRLREWRIRRGRRVQVLAPLFPAYAFVEVANEQWWAARWCVGVSALIMNGAGPAHVADRIIDEIRGREVAGALEFWRARADPAGLARGSDWRARRVACARTLRRVDELVGQGRVEA